MISSFARIIQWILRESRKLGVSDYLRSCLAPNLYHKLRVVRRYRGVNLPYRQRIVAASHGHNERSFYLPPPSRGTQSLHLHRSRSQYLTPMLPFLLALFLQHFRLFLPRREYIGNSYSDQSGSICLMQVSGPSGAES